MADLHSIASIQQPWFYKCCRAFPTLLIFVTLSHGLDKGASCQETDESEEKSSVSWYKSVGNRADIALNRINICPPPYCTIPYSVGV